MLILRLALLSGGRISYEISADMLTQVSSDILARACGLRWLVLTRWVVRA